MKTQKGKYTTAKPKIILIKKCLRKHLIPNYAMIKIPNTSPASKFTQQKA
jgi:hypothetical protein